MNDYRTMKHPPQPIIRAIIRDLKAELDDRAMPTHKRRGIIQDIIYWQARLIELNLPESE